MQHFFARKNLKNICFTFWCFFYTQKLFLEKNKQAWNCLDNLIMLYYWRVPLSTCILRIYLYTFIFICDHLWESILFMEIFLICDFLSLYENKQIYEYHHLKQIFCHQKQIMIFWWFRMFPFYVFALNSPHFMSDFFFSLTKCLWTH